MSGDGEWCADAGMMSEYLAVESTKVDTNDGHLVIWIVTGSCIRLPVYSGSGFGQADMG